MPYFAHQVVCEQEPLARTTVHRSKKDGDWYTYPEFLAKQKSKTTNKITRKWPACTILLVLWITVWQNGLVCASLTDLGLQGIMGKGTAAI